MAAVIYGLCALTSFLCTWLLFQAWGRSRYRLLLWGGLCFGCLTLNNLLLITDKLLLPDVHLSLWRLGAALTAMLILLFGLIWDRE